MNQEIILDFVNIPGVSGVALIHGQAQLYLYVKQTLNWQEKQALTQRILQIIAKTPEEFEFVEFKVMDYHGYTYKLNPNFTFLVLTDTDIAAIKLRTLAAKQLKAALQKDIDRAITTFKLLTSKIPQPSPVSTAGTAETYFMGDKSDNAPLEVKVTIEELLNALNHLSQFSSNYMGTQLTANYWQLTRLNFDWLDNFRINRSAEIAFSGVITEPVSALQHKWVKEWTAAFIKQCSQIIQDLPTMIEKTGLDEREKKLLLVKVTIEELLNALNHLSQFSSNYMGTQLTANYWQLTRLNFDWLDNFRINHSAEIAFSGVITEPVSDLQHKWVKEWTAAFIKQCSQIIQDLPTMIEKTGLDEREKRLLLTPPAG